jgi:hypothetical protein
MSRCWYVVAAPVAALALFVSGKSLSADPKNQSKGAADVFAGKILSISSKGVSEYGAVLEKVTVRELGGKSFLVGTAVDTGDGEAWTKGRVTWFQVDEAGQIVEFDNVDQLKRAHRDAAP